MGRQIHIKASTASGVLSKRISKLHCGDCASLTDPTIGCKTPSLLDIQVQHLKIQISYLNP